MNCLFCPSKDLIPGEQFRNSNWNRYVSCPRCRTNYVFENGGQSKLLQYSFHTCYKGTAYSATFDLVNTIFTLQVVAYPIRERNIIVTTNSLPHITPYTFYSKLGTYILFS